MTRKSINTAQVVLTCDVCGRRLLRGEHAETFIAGGGRRTVCELCVPRAAHEGWMREGLDDIAVRHSDGRGSRSLLGRLRQRREAYVARGAEPVEDEPVYAPVPEHVHAVPTNAEMKMSRAVEVFNTSDSRRTVAGVARSLGAPSVTVRPSRTEGSVVAIVSAWEITWYRFEVDLGNEAAGVRVVDQGSELGELDPADLEPNAAAAADGTISLVG